MQQSVHDKCLKTTAMASRCCLKLQRKRRCITSGEAEGKRQLGRGKINPARRGIVLKKSVLTIPPPLCSGVQPLPVRQRFDAGQRLLQETGRQEVAQHGQPELHEEVHQAVERRVVDAGHHPEGI